MMGCMILERGFGELNQFFYVKMGRLAMGQEHYFILKVFEKDDAWKKLELFI